MQNVYIPPFLCSRTDNISPFLPQSRIRRKKLFKEDRTNQRMVYLALNTTRKDWAYLSDDSHVSVVRQPGHKPFAFGRIRFRP